MALAGRQVLERIQIPSGGDQAPQFHRALILTGSTFAIVYVFITFSQTKATRIVVARAKILMG
jgi:hypothetical protein